MRCLSMNSYIQLSLVGTVSDPLFFAKVIKLMEVAVSHVLFYQVDVLARYEDPLKWLDLIESDAKQAIEGKCCSISISHLACM